MNRHVMLLLACAAGLAAGTFALAQATNPPAASQPASQPAGVQVVGLSIAKSDPSEKFGGSLAMGLMAGTSVKLMAADPGKTFISVDEASSLETFADDKGTDLKADKSRRGFGGSFGFTRISEDGHKVSFDVSAGAVPAAGATSLRVKGKLVLVAGADLKQAVQADAALAKGTKLSAGPLDATVTETKEQDWGGEKQFVVSLESSKSLDAIRKVVFKGADGKEIPSDVTSSGRMGMFGKMTYTRDYSLKAKADKASIEVHYFDKMEKVEVPFDLKVTMGL